MSYLYPDNEEDAQRYRKVYARRQAEAEKEEEAERECERRRLIKKPSYF